MTPTVIFRDLEERDIDLEYAVTHQKEWLKVK